MCSCCCPVAKSCPFFATPRTAAHQASLSFTVSWRLLKLWSIESVMLSNHLILCCPILLLPSVFLRFRIFSNKSVLCIRWPNWNFSISPSNEYSGLISFRMDWFDLLAIQEALKSLLKHHNLKASILQRLAFMVQLSHPHMTTGKTIALTIQIFVGKVVSLLLSALSRFFIACLSRSKHLLISWLQSLSTVILEPKNIKPVSASTFSPSINIWHELMGLDAMISGFLMLNFKPAFHSPLSPSRKGSLGPVLVSANFFLHFSNTRDAKITSLF